MSKLCVHVNILQNNQFLKELQAAYKSVSGNVSCSRLDLKNVVIEWHELP